MLTYVTNTNNTKGIICDTSSFHLVNTSVYQNILSDDFATCTSCEFSGMFTVDPCAASCARDKCTVCNGNNACLSGCDMGMACIVLHRVIECSTMELCRSG